MPRGSPLRKTGASDRHGRISHAAPATMTSMAAIDIHFHGSADSTFGSSGSSSRANRHAAAARGLRIISSTTARRSSGLVSPWSAENSRSLSASGQPGSSARRASASRKRGTSEGSGALMARVLSPSGIAADPQARDTQGSPSAWPAIREAAPCPGLNALAGRASLPAGGLASSRAGSP